MRLVLFILIAIGGLSARAQGDKQASFPDAYLGVYKGALHINSPRGTNELPMEFHLLPTKMEGEYHYTLVYGAGADRQERKYRLVEKDREKGLYVVDEDNGIVLDDKVVGNRMYSFFEVMGNLLTTFITFNEDHMVFEIVVSNRKEVNITHATADSTEVSSYPISTVQRAVLQKQQ